MPQVLYLRRKLCLVALHPCKRVAKGASMLEKFPGVWVGLAQGHERANSLSSKWNLPLLNCWNLLWIQAGALSVDDEARHKISYTPNVLFLALT